MGIFYDHENIFCENKTSVIFRKMKNGKCCVLFPVSSFLKKIRISRIKKEKGKTEKGHKSKKNRKWKKQSLLEMCCDVFDLIINLRS